MKLIEDYRNTLVKIDEIDELIMGISHDELIFYRNKIQKLIDLIERYKDISVSKPENHKDGVYIREGKYTDFIKIIAAMYAEHYFVKSDGSPFTSRKELLEYLSLNIKFNIKTFNNNLFKSKFAGDEYLMKPFKELEEALETLLNIERKSHNK
ncbi:MAG: hypothetical protein IJ023_08770 [Bacteroidales bacterium]|jgi:hypothetical protein|nr:hypothetical protein [Bacteroidales bacterium]